MLSRLFSQFSETIKIIQAYGHREDIAPPTAQATIVTETKAEAKEVILPSTMRVKPETYESLHELMLALDADPAARHTQRDDLELALGGTSFFTTAGHAGLVKRKDFIAFLAPKEFAEVFQRVLKEKIAFLKQNNQNLSNIPGFYNILDQMIGTVLFGIQNDDQGIYSGIANLRRRRIALDSLVEPFLRSVATEENLRRLQGLAPKNYLSHVLKNLIKQQHPELNTEEKFADYARKLTVEQFKKYLDHPEIRGFIMIFFAVDNLAEKMKTCVQTFLDEPMRYVDPEPNSDKQRAFIEDMLRNARDEVTLNRRTSRPISAAGYVIPANCTVTVVATEAQKNVPQGKLSLFSAGTRPCPAAPQIIRPLLTVLMNEISSDPTFLPAETAEIIRLGTSVESLPIGPLVPAVADDKETLSLLHRHAMSEFKGGNNVINPELLNDLEAFNLPPQLIIPEKEWEEWEEESDDLFFKKKIISPQTPKKMFFFESKSPPAKEKDDEFSPRISLGLST